MSEGQTPHPARTRHPLALLLLGGGLIFMTFMRYGLPQLGWVAFAPLLLVLHDRGTLGRHLAVLATLLVAFLAAVSKMATAEIPWAPVPMFAIPLAISYFLALTLAGLAHRRLGARWGVYTFASVAVVLGWIQYSYTPGSSWGVLAHTQLDNLPLVQLAALTDGQSDGVMVVAVPSRRVSTVYAITGEMVPLGAFCFCLLVAFRLLRSRRTGGTAFQSA